LKLNLIHALVTSVLMSIAALAHADTSDPESCVEKKDKKCLELISKELRGNSNI